MESLVAWLSILVSVTLTSIALLKQRRSRPEDAKKRPPGPPMWPVFGNMFDLGSTAPHQAMYKLRAKYGPVLWLRLGYRNTLVIQSARAAEELFKSHDSIFCDRSVPLAFTAHGYSEGSLALGRYGPSWRMLRRLCSMELMTNKRINDAVLIRRKCIDDMIQYMMKDVAAARSRGEAEEIVLPHYLFIMTFNIIGNLTLSQDLLNSQSKDGYEFYNAMNKVMKWGGEPNVADFLPLLKRLDPQGLKRNMEKDLGQALGIIKKFLRERVEQKSGGQEAKNDFLDALLEYQGDGKEGPDKISDHNILIIILVKLSNYLVSSFSCL
ncbi:hypothetical protein Tsubulata_047438 [Turnera subulata]|uniref:Cytochrome P450 n=1 Tax=Turnera subulata TaxID=218843 RepID=A0A9Q0FWK8_9ROSI|nr:hypothetical protein Tsubulata_047438 [Turnera subulata]